MLVDEDGEDEGTAASSVDVTGERMGLAQRSSFGEEMFLQRRVGRGFSP